MNKKEFILLCQKHLKIDADGTDLLTIFNLFMVHSVQPMSGQHTKVVNVLEFLSSLILLVTFGDESPNDLL
jgi:hypothetical protein